jgi:predicted aldo/keto reductase-like oxidoreductase
MEKRRLGKTEMMVSTVGFGGIPLQKLDQETVNKLIDEAISLGINFIDSARAYTISEELIGNALIGRRDKMYIASKTAAKDYETAKKDIEISLKNLKTDYLDLYQFHFVRSMEQYNQIISENGAYRAFKEAMDEGKIRNIGITSHSADILMNVIESGLFSTIQFPYNPIEKQGEEMFKRSKELDLGTIVMKPVAGGAFERGELSIKWILNNNNIDVAIPGMDNIDQVRINAKSGFDYNLNEEELTLINKTVSELGDTFCRRCGYCLPCPQGIDIPSMFVIDAYMKRYKLNDWANIRYDALDVKANACVECGKCETKCPYNLPIINMLKNVTKTFGR